MVDFTGKKILVDGFKSAFDRLSNKPKYSYFDSTQKRIRFGEAMTAINQATLETERFIKNQGYDPNTDLSRLWHEALNSSIAADLGDDLPEYLYNEAKFWGEPREWFNHPASLEIVPTLEELKKRCDQILVRLYNLDGASNCLRYLFYSSQSRYL